MSCDPKVCRNKILLLQAQLDSELGSVGDEIEFAHLPACAECQAAFEVVIQVAEAVRSRLTRHALPARARRKLLERLRKLQE
jgi:hypothetical protein